MTFDPHKKRRRRSKGDIIEQARAEGRPITAEEGRRLFKPKPPRESDEQREVVRRCRTAGIHVVAMPNQHVLEHDREGALRRWAILKADGVDPGYPDLLLDRALGGYHGLRIEMKREADYGKAEGEPRENQREWHERLTTSGYCVFVCWGAEAAWLAIRWYTGLPLTVTPCEPPPIPKARYII